LLYVADTYNNKIKRIDPATRTSVTLFGTGEEGFADGENPLFYEPGGLDYANGKLYIADTNNHAIRVADLASGEVTTIAFPNVERLQAALTPVSIAPDAGSTFGSSDPMAVILLAPQVVAAGAGTLVINITMPEGYKLNDAATFTAVWPDDAIAQIPPDLRDIRMVKPHLPIEVPVTFATGQTELALALTVYWCDGDF